MFSPLYTSFETLPDFPEYITQPENPSKKILALIPVFRDPYIDVKNVPAFIKSAAYSRASCLKYTDAREMDIEVKLYVQKGIELNFSEVFKANHIDLEKDVLFFNERPPGLGNNVWSRLGKKTRSYYHFSLAEYQRIVCFDVDIWFINPISMFQKIAALPLNMIAYAEVNLDEVDRMKRRIEQHTFLNGLALDTLLERADITDLPETLAKPLGYFWTHPAASLLTEMEFFDFVCWISDHSPYIGNDENIMALASHKFGYTLHSLKTIEGFTFERVRDVISQKTPNAHLAHGKAPYKQDDAFNAFLKAL